MSDVKMEMKDMTRDICSIMDKLATGMLGDVSNPQNVSVDEMMSVADMIKDLAEAKEKLIKAKYYESIVCAMDDEENKYGEDYDEYGPFVRAGYRGKNPKTGRYVPGMDDNFGYPEPMFHSPMDNYRMGYRDAQEHSRLNDNSTNMNGIHSKHGMAYDNYQNAKRYYTEHPTEENKMTMKTSWDEAVDDAIQALKKMYMDAEPMMKRKVNEKVTRALQEMPPA